MRLPLATAAAVALAGCALPAPERNWPISERWAVSDNASEACLSAARRASRYCLDKTLNSDIWGSHTSECTKAQWEYTRGSCR